MGSRRAPLGPDTSLMLRRAAETDQHITDIAAAEQQLHQHAAAYARRLLVRDQQATVPLGQLDRADPVAARLITTLAALRAAQRERIACRQQRDWWRYTISPLLRRAWPLWHRLVWLPTSTHDRDQAITAYDELTGWWGRSHTHGAREAIAGQHAASSPARWDSARAWAEFDRDPASFEVLLERVSAATEAAVGSTAGVVPDQLRAAIDQVVLDTRLLRATLRRYQEFGARFLLAQRRAILGDEMGLGKTLQAVATACHVLAADPSARVLVVVPTAVLANWTSEIRHCSDLEPLVLHGSQRGAQARRWRQHGGIAVTSYGTLPTLGSVTASMVIGDEAHYVKNPQAKRTKALHAVVRRAERVVLLTGTPMTTHPREFRRLVWLADPNLRLPEVEQCTTAEWFQRAVASVYLRRHQSEVLGELPEAIEQVDWVRLTQQDQARVAEHRASGNWMKQQQATFGQAKEQRLVELVEQARQAHRKVLVFSYFRETVSRVVELVEHAYGPITGSLSARQRQEMIDRFAADGQATVLAAQIGAGGTGLNIQSASMVVLCEPQTTPAAEQQAIARAHRMGQQRSVLVHRLVALDSIDEGVRQGQQGKWALFESYADPSAAAQLDPRAHDSSTARAETPIAG